MDPGYIYIGTSGWHYAHWRGNFYPTSLSSRKWLDYYAGRYPCVELNSSFYRLPGRKTITAWLAQTPPSFTFAVKASRLITHMKKLRDCGTVFERFQETIKLFCSKLGPVLFQLPPHWSVNTGRLQDFLSILPPGRHYVFEFRDPSWYCEEVYRQLEQHNAALCISDFGSMVLPAVMTADFVYARLHGPTGDYRGSYRRAELKAWASRIQGWRMSGNDVYVFFNNDEAAYAAANAADLRDLCCAAEQ